MNKRIGFGLADEVGLLILKLCVCTIIGMQKSTVSLSTTTNIQTQTGEGN